MASEGRIRKELIEDIYPLSPLQEGMLFHSLRSPGLGLYVQQVRYTLRGALDVERFREAWKNVAARHQPLRTAFLWEKRKRPLQVVYRQAALPWQELDLRGLPEEEGEARAKAFLGSDGERGFELGKAPLTRFAMLRLRDDLFQFVWSVHHLILDGWSISLILKEVLAIYGENGGARLEAPRPFGDYIAWLQEQDGARAEAFWRRELAGFTAPSRLGLERRLGPKESTDEEVRARLPEPVTAALQRFARRHHLTVSTVVQGAWAMLLSRYGGEEDVVFGTVVSGRPPSLEGVESLVGMLINTQPRRVRVPAGERLSAWLKALQSHQAELRQYEHTPLAEIQKWSEVPRGEALFDSLLVFENFPLPSGAGRNGGLQVVGVDSVESTSFPLTLMARVIAGEMPLRLFYERGRFDRPSMVRLLGHFQTLLSEMVAEEERRLSDLRLLSEVERHQACVEWNDTALAAGGEACLHELVAAQVERTPDAPALVAGDVRLSYRDLHRRAGRLARRLRGLGVGPEILVGLCVGRSADLVVGALGILQAGGAYVPLDPAYPRERLAFMLEDTRTPILVTEEGLRDKLPAGGARIVCLDGEGDHEDEGEAPAVRVRPEHLAYLIYTSGSTGLPKGSSITHRSAAALVRWALGVFRAEELAGVLASTSICFDLSVFELFVPLAGGGRVILADNALEFPELPAAAEVTLVNTVPSAMAELVRERPLPASLAVVNLAGEPLTRRLADAIHAAGTVRLLNLYGPSEDTTYSTFAEVEAGSELAPAIGRPLAGTRAYVLDRQLRPVPTGIAGELYLGGAGLARGYLARPALTAERFVPDPFGEAPGGRLYRTGDRVRHRPDGSLDFLGRLDHQVKIRGHRIELGEIEDVLSRHPAVRETVVTAWGGEGEAPRRLVAYVIPAAEAPRIDELRSFLKRKLPDPMVPSVFVTLPALPLTPSGKVDRRALPAPDAARPELEKAFVAPRDPVEERIAAIWAEVLRVERVGVHDDFFDLGGDSILSLQIVSRCNQAGLRLSPKQVFEHPTVAGLAAVSGVGRTVTAEQDVVTGEAPLTPVQHWFFEQELPDPHHFNQAMLLEVRRPVEAGRLERAMESLLLHHDALRLRFVRGPEGWRQTHAAPGGPAPFLRIDLSALGEEMHPAAIASAAGEVQASLDLSAGPLIRAALLTLGSGRPDRLLIVIHHLAVDGVSWRILLEDLHSACESLPLPPKTTSYQRWALGLVERAQSGALEAERSHWLDPARGRSLPLPLDDPAGMDTVVSARRETVALSEEETRSLLRDVPEIYRTQINDVLLTALVEAFARWTGSRRLLVDLEGHGREEILEGVDLTRTVGWFTAIFPVLLDLEGIYEPGEALRSVKERLRAIPARGVGYGLLRYLSGDFELAAALRSLPRAEVSFNYLGQLDPSLPGSSPFAVARESGGLLASGRQARRYRLEVAGRVAGGRLQVTWIYSSAVHRRETIELLAQGFLAALRRLIDHCRSVKARVYTPSDFPLARLDQEALDALVARYGDLEDVYPLGPTQQGMLFFHLFAPRSEAYFQQLSFTFHGHPDLTAFRRAWERVMQRHAVLRTAFVWQGTRDLLQVVCRRCELPWQELDWRGPEEDGNRERLIRFLQDERRRGFDLSKAPAMRLTVVRLAEEVYHFVWNYHHTLLDGWSLPLVVGEVVSLYHAFTGGEEADLPSRPPYRDYVAWLQRQDLAAAERYWRRTLEGLTAPIQLAIDRAPGAVTTAEGEFRSRAVGLSEATTASLKVLARQHQITLNTLVQAAWALLLGRCSGSPDVVFGVISSGRPADLRDVEAIVGLFITTLPMRVAVSAEQELLPWLQDLFARQIELRQYEYTPLVEIQSWTELPGGQPLFETILIFENYPAQAVAKNRWGARLRVANPHLFERTSYPLAVFALPGEELWLGLSYECDRFGDAAISRLAGQLTTLLEGLAGGSGRRLGDLPWLSEAERQQLQAEWNDTRVAWRGEELAHELFAAQARRTPAAPAVICGGRGLAYGELSARAGALARRLAGLGVGPDVVVGILAGRGVDFLTAVLGVLEAGGAYLPLDPAHPVRRHSQVLEQADLSLVLVERSLEPVVRQALEGLPSGPRVVRFEDLLDQPAGDGPMPRRAAPSSLAYVIYTSGSTGMPKGAMVEHRGMLNHLRAKILDLGLRPGDRVAQTASQCFDISVWQLLAALLVGGQVHIFQDEVAHDAARLIEEVDRGEIAILETVPSLMRFLLIEAGERGERRPELRALRWMIPTGEALPPDLVRLWLGVYPAVPLLNAYGPTECSDDVSHHPIREAEAVDGAIVPIGRPIANLRLHVADRDLRPLPAEVPGELCVGGAGVGRGYRNDPARTAEAFVPDPFGGERGGRMYRTGDLVRTRPDGVLEFLGRIDHQVKVRGFRIELGEIEAVLARHPAVRTAVVLAEEERLLAFVVPAPGATPAAEPLRGFLLETLPEYMVPAAFVELESLPLTPNGKVDRRALARRIPATEPVSTGMEEAPSGPVEEVVAAIWAELLGRESVGRKESFFALGGHSLLATRVMSRVRSIFGVEVPLRSLFEEPTVCGLARRIEAASRGGEAPAAPPIVPVPRAGELPLSFSQERLWFLDQLEPGSPVYNMPMSVRFSAGLDVGALARSLSEVVRRHEALRTVFPAVADRPVQAVQPAAPVPLPVVDLSGLPAGRLEAEGRRLARDEARRPFDLARGPLLRVAVLDLGGGEHAVLATMHHIVSDGWSTGLFRAEMAALYEAFRSGSPSTLPELQVQYADFAVWQRQWLQGEWMERELAYWRGRLDGAPALLELPADRPRPAVRSPLGRTEGRLLPAGLADRLRRLGVREGATLFMTLLAVFQTLLGRYAGRTDICLGTPVAGRSRLELEDLIGLFVNTLVLRGDLSGDPSFRVLLAQARQRVLEAHAHQDLPFERLVEELAPERSLSHAPLFQVMLVLLEAPRQERRTATGPRMSGLAVESGTAKFDLTLSVLERADGLAVAAEYSVDLFDPATVRRLLGHLETLLEGAAERPDRRISELPLLTAAERQQLAEWSRAGNAEPAEVCLHDLFEAQAARSPEAAALACGEQALSYRELAGWAARLGDRLRAAGVGPEARVGICLRRGPGLVAGLLGILRSGGAYVPLDPAYPRERLAFLLEDSGASVLLTETDLLDRLPPFSGRRLLLDEEEPVAQPASGRSLPENLAYVIYTSGSTGRPKGVGIEHRAAVALLRWGSEAFSAAELSGVLASTSISFDLSVFEIFLPLSRGGKVILVENALDLPAAAGVTLVNTVPSAAAELVRMDALPSSVRTVNLAGEPLRRSLVDQIYERGIERVWNLYGPTEDTTYSTSQAVSLDDRREPGIGRPVTGGYARVLDLQGHALPVGVPGELYLGGAGLARCYLGRPELTAERFVPDPFSGEPGARLYRTGDLVRHRPEGDLEFIGRLDHQVKVRGFRIELGEVESALRALPQVREAAVLVRDGLRLVAYVVPREGAPGDLRSALLEILPEHMVPSSFLVLEALPLTPNGKVDRGALARIAPAASEAVEAPLDPVEEVVAAIWAELLGRESLGRRESFFDLGGHSLLATRVMSRVRGVFGVELPLRALFEEPTVAGLAARIGRASRSREAPPPIEPAPRGVEPPLSFSQQRLWLLERLEPGGWAYNMPVSVRFQTGLDPAALARSLSEVVRRHEVLRTVFPPTAEGRPTQVVRPAKPVPLPVVDLSRIPEPAREREARRLAAAEARRPFDLAQGPLLRAAVLHLGGGGHVALVTMHHIVSDGWSLRIFRSEMAALYEAFRAGRPSPLADLPLQYADFAAWQHRWLAGEALESQLAYWRHQLRDLPPPVLLPAARPERAGRRIRGAGQLLRLSRESADGLRKLCRSEASTPFMALLAGWLALVHRYTGEADLCVGTPIAGRNRLETEGLIGFFLNTLVIRADLSGGPSFRELLARVREVTLGAFAHQDLPFEKLIEELQPERAMGRTPLFQVLFNMLNFGAVGEAASEPSGPDRLAIPDVSVKLDLAVHAREGADGIEIQLHYDTDIFERAQMEALAEHLGSLLDSVAADPGRRLPDLPLARAAAWRERAECVEASIPRRFAEVAARHPDRVAVETAAHRWTYAQLDRLSGHTAHALLAAMDREPAVALLCGHDAPMVAAVLAALKAGKTCVPLDPAYPQARLAFMLGDSLAGAILADAAHAGLARELSGGRIPVLELRSEVEGAAPARPLPEVPPDALAYVLYTSGSTGEPKGVMQSHANVLRHIRAYTRGLGISPEDRLSLLASFSFDAAVMDLFGALLNGAALCPFDVRGEGVEPLPGWLVRQGITIYHSTPTLFRRFLDAAEDLRFPAVRLVVLGGEKCLRRDFERFREHFPPACVFVNGLGPTESTLALQLFASAADEIERETVSVGLPVEGTGVRLWNRAGEQVAVYGTGEIELRSPALALGYWRRPDLTAAAFVPDAGGSGDRAYRTGDLGRWLPDGSLEFAGRADSQVKIRGHRVETGEVESRLNLLPGVREAVVTAREEDGEARLVAYLLAGEGPAPGDRELRTALRDHLPEFMIPSDFVVLDAWPLTPTGKVDRAALPAPSRGREEPGEEGGEPRSPVEELLCGFCEELLKANRVGVHDDFFALGGHSLLATQLASRVRAALGVEVPLRAVFEAPTPAALARGIETALRRGGDEDRLPVLPGPRGGEPPLSYAQERLWFLDRLQPGSAVYNMPFVLRLGGRLELPALAAAFTEVARRHEVLRATFAESDGRPVQAIAPAAPVPLPVHDLAALPPDRRRAEARRLAREEARRPFDLARGPLFRVRLLRLEEREHGVLLTLHHIASDGWSSGILRREVSRLYAAFSAGRPSPLPEPPVQYADFARWQRERLRGGLMEAQLSVWRERLRGLPERLDLPLDRPRPAVPSLRGGVQPLALPADLSQRLRQVGLREGCTPFMVLLAALQALLARLAGEEDLCVGTPVAGRTRVEVEGLIGLFVNTLVLRGDLSGDPSFRELLRRTRETALQAHAHQDLPFEKLVEALQPERSLGVSPLFQVMFALQNVRRDPVELQGLDVSSPSLATGSAKFDLSVTAVDAPRGISGAIEYAAELFDASTVARWAGHLHTLLEAAAGDPDLRLSGLPLLEAGERHQLLLEWNDTAAVDARDDLCLHELVVAQARRTPEAVAAVFDGTSLTYRQLDERSLRLASRLAAAGAGEGSFVPVLVDRGLDLVVALLAVLRSGAAFVPLDPEWPAARLETILDEVGGPVVLVDRHAPPLPDRPLLRADSLPQDGAAPEPAGTRDAGRPIYAIYTSGSTGRPKGVVVPHRGIVNRFLWMDRFFGTSAAACVLQTTRPVYDSVVWQIFWPLIHGGATVLTAPGQGASPADVAGLIARHRVTLADFVPSVFHYFVEQADPAALSSLSAVVVGGEEMSADAARVFLRLLPGVTLVNLYGPTEASIGCIYHPVREAGGGRVPIGRPISNVHPVILDRWDQPAPVGVAGELCLAGRCLGLGYLRDEEQTRRAFVPNPVSGIGGETVYRTGDLARRLPDGTIDFLGRIDHQVKIRGLRIELGEIEAALREHPDVEAAVALAWTEEANDARGRRLVAFAVARPGREMDGEALRTFLGERLPAFMVPSALVLLPALPLTPGGKVDRRALSRLVPRPGRLPAEEGAPGPRTPFEELLAGIWIEVLRVDRAGPEDDFFALGGHSLLATQVVSRVRQGLGVELPIRALFETPTLAGLARRIEAGLLAGERPDRPPIAPVPRHGELPLSFAQQRLWFLDRLTPGAGVYKLFTPLRLTGELDVRALAGGLAGVARRHESLRTAFPAVDGRPVQAIAPAGPVPLPLLDLAGLQEEARREEARRALRGERERAFDLERGPLFRALLVRLGAADHALFLSVHHAVCDGWSIGLLIRELAVLYRALSRGEAAPLPALPIQYADFAVWQREWLRGEILGREVEHWRRQLAGAPPVLELPADRPRPAVQSFRGGRLPFAAPEPFSGKLAAFSRQAGGTLFMTLLAGLDALLHRYSGQARILVGTPIANRNVAEVEGLIGNFANTLVLAVELEGALPFRVLAARVRETALAAYAHQDLPFETLVEALSPRRDLSYNPVFQVLLALHNLPPSAPLATGLAVTPLPAEGSTARLDLALDLAESPEGLRGAFEYASDLFDAATVARLGEHLKVLLEGATADPDRRLADLPLLAAAERHQLLVEWNDSRAHAPEAACLHELFEAWAERTPEAVAVVCGAERLTYGELDRRANGLARRLRRMGVGPEVPVGLFLERSPDLVVGVLGVLKAGGAYVPVDPSYPRQRAAWILEASGVPVLVTRGALAAALPDLPAERVDLDLVGPEAEAPEPSAGPDDLAYVIFTSGSTGRPKGVQITHRSAVHLMETTGPRFRFGPADVWTIVHSYAFDLSVWEFWGALAHGGRLVVVPLEIAQSPEALAGLLVSEGVTVLSQTPSAARQLVDSGGAAAREALRSLRMLAVGGEALPRDLAPRLLAAGRPVWNFYGPTEATVWAAAGQVSAGAGGEGSVPLGRPLPGYRLFVLGPGLQPLPTGVPGELSIAGPGLARGYHGDPVLTAERFVPDPFGAPGRRLYRTGDLARALPDGTLDFLGRRDQQVKVRGFRIELGEIEAVLAEHPGVRQAVAAVLETAPGEKTLAAWVVPSGAEAASAEELRAHAAGRLPAYMVPAFFTTLDALPLTPNGKVDRQELARHAPGLEREPRAETVPPRDALELRLVRIWESLLPARPVGVTDSFFDLGGHSMLAVRLMSRLRSELGRDLPVSDLFRLPTIEKLAASLRGEEVTPARGALVEIQGGGGREPLFWVHPISGNVLCYLELTRALGPDQPFYGLQAFQENGTAPPARIEDMAERYIEVLRAVRPEGPYRLGGWSMGGLVAFEMARQLSERGGRVGALTLVDVLAPAPAGNGAGGLGGASLIQAFARNLAGPLGKTLEIPRDDDGLDDGELLRRVFERARRQRVVPADLGFPEVEKLFRVFQANHRAMRSYVARPYRGPMTLVLASETLARSGGAHGWDSLAPGGVELHVLPGDHFSVMRRPCVQGLAERLRGRNERPEERG